MSKKDDNKNAYKSWAKSAANVKQNIDYYKKRQKEKQKALLDAMNR